MGQRGFFPITVINQAREKDMPLMQKVNKWRRNGGRCDLATQLQSSTIPYRERKAGLWKIELSDIDSIKKLGRGASALVYKVSWRNGTYAMKSYYRSGFEAKHELYVASKVLHPHIVHEYGCIVTLDSGAPPKIQQYLITIGTFPECSCQNFKDMTTKSLGKHGRWASASIFILFLLS